MTRVYRSNRDRLSSCSWTRPPAAQRAMHSPACATLMDDKSHIVNMVAEAGTPFCSARERRVLASCIRMRRSRPLAMPIWLSSTGQGLDALTSGTEPSIRAHRWQWLAKWHDSSRTAKRIFLKAKVTCSSTASVGATFCSGCWTEAVGPPRRRPSASKAAKNGTRAVPFSSCAQPARAA